MDTLSPELRRRWELRVFLFLTVVLFPALAVAIVGGYGFAVWIFQIFTGPPGPIAQ
ncbi:periplasmic nitrate reductase, NapE protein [Tahibacter amnicola]|uniref:Periplasmic nitrate reductase, NapE protein n=1 Tax=Tahibacter amnicola TaxID=2976241 RepID=A0ABY6BLF0_9GAMM|nr:periplasmic nitrate reductase, NapE protein [Tahibacter amnicola]UXI70599.1 periplasmic nitrate reductase, NapE protein [Tahibacter amnicola]